jgi:hypothetical protein
MLCVGDGLTDIPCFFVVKKGIREPTGGGIVFGVFNPSEQKSAKQALQE